MTDVMTTCLEKSCSFGLLCMYFVNVYQFLCVLFFPFGFQGGLWDLIALIPGNCLSINLGLSTVYQSYQDDRRVLTKVCVEWKPVHN